MGVLAADGADRGRGHLVVLAMRHDWHDPRPNSIEFLMAPAFRKCRNCGAEQELDITHEWMRIVSRRWVPLVGRCRPVKRRARRGVG